MLVDRDSGAAEASEFVDEVEDEDDGVWHAQDAIGSLLQARLICADEQNEMSGHGARAGRRQRSWRPF